MGLLLGADARACVGANRHHRDLVRLPVHRSVDRDLVGLVFDLLHLVDPVADGDVRDDLVLDLAKDRIGLGVVLGAREAHGGLALLLLENRRAALDDSDHATQIEGVVRVEQRGAGVQAIHPHVLRIEAELLPIAIVEAAHDARAGRPHEVDGPLLLVDAARHHLRAQRERGEIDVHLHGPLGHQFSPVAAVAAGFEVPLEVPFGFAAPFDARLGVGVT
jgi:hypothetical protein